jgi:aldose 1-epimerase
MPTNITLPSDTSLTVEDFLARSPRFSQTSRLAEKIPADLIPALAPPSEQLESVLLIAGAYRAVVTAWGARLLSFVGPDGVDTVVGPRNALEIMTDGSAMGAVVGRVANRIGFGRLHIPGQGVYQLPCNDGQHHLHGGPAGFDKKFWQITHVSSAASESEVMLTLDSPDGDQGYPGSIRIEVTYRLNHVGDLTVVMASHVAQAITPVNLTHHAYWNLASGTTTHSALNHYMFVNCRSYLETDTQHLPTGRILSVRETPFDFTEGKSLGMDLPRATSPHQVDGYDVYLTGLTSTNDGTMPVLARIHDDASSRELTIRSDQPGFQLYTGNYLKAPYIQHQAVCVEPSGYVDATSHPDFPSCLAAPGDVVRQTVVFQLRCL